MFIFFECMGTVHQELFPPGLRVNQYYFQEVWQCLRQQVCQKHVKQWWNHDWLIHYGSAPQHTALAMKQFFAAKNMAVVALFSGMRLQLITVVTRSITCSHFLCKLLLYLVHSMVRKYVLSRPQI
jgi:hypothetical protein